MSKYDKKYDAFKLFENLQNKDNPQYSFQPGMLPSSSSQRNSSEPASLDEGMYYEIEYDACPMPGVGKFVLKPQKIEAPARDEVRDIFNQMRDIARKYCSLFYNSSKFYDKRVQQENARIFYKQGIFMAEFEDNYEKSVPFSSYFPNYQMMGYEQLRTYFTWRTEVRKGNVWNISLSYAFVYIYELLNNIGVAGPQDGLDKLLFFWKEFRVYDPSIDKYVLKWLKDYYIYYEFPQSFQEFTDKNNLGMHYPDLSDSEDNFDLYCTISKYDIRKSVFYTDDKIKLIRDCFSFTLDRLKQIFEENDINFEECIFQPRKNMSVWTPFRDALFFPWLKQPDRQVILAKKEIYICIRNTWSHSTVLILESGKRLVGYMMKQMEAILRKAAKYKYSISASLNTVNHEAVTKLSSAGISLEKIITDAVTEFYREATKTVVKLDRGSLARIRQEALQTQERLIVPEENEIPAAQPQEAAPAPSFSVILPEETACRNTASPPQPAESLPFPLPQEASFSSASVSVSSAVPENGPWDELRNALNQIELEALLIAFDGTADIRQFADKHGIMPEVLMDGINEKAMDVIGDSLLDNEFMIYDDYTEQVRGMVKKV